MNRTLTKLTSVVVALALCLMGTTAWVRAQAWDNGSQAVTDSMLLSDPAASWLHTNGNLAGHRYSALTRLNTSNVSDLQVEWVYSLGGKTDVQTTPLYHDGIVYFAQDNVVFAIDARSGGKIWKYVHELPETFDGHNVNFVTSKHGGLAIYGEYVYFLSNDAKLHAIHYRTGEKKFVSQLSGWNPYDSESFDRIDLRGQTGYAAIVGPTAIPGQIIVLLATADLHNPSGFVLSVNPEDGEILWECSMNPGEPGYEIRSGDRADHSVTGSWSSGSWDPDLKMYYTSTAKTYHPSMPGLHGEGKSGSLGAVSVAACSTNTGELVWRHDRVSDDPSDLNAQTPMVITIDGRKNIVYPDRNGSIHYLDAQTGGEFPRTQPYADRINWIRNYNVEGLVDQPELSIAGGGEIEIWPTLVGDMNMHTYSNAYNPGTRNLYLTATNADVEYRQEGIEFIGNAVSYLGSPSELVRGYVEPAILLAANVESGKESWRSKPGHAGNMLTTAGDLLFYTSQTGVFHAVNATTGEILYTFNLGMTSKSGPITYLLDGEQYVLLQLAGSAPDWGYEEHRPGRDSVIAAFSLY